jgi:glyoxylase-like metal-dependent hydrolase (beta-lactamase superfamily II)
MGNIKIGRMVLGMCQTNCYFLYREGGSECIVVDPADYGANIYKALTGNGFRVSGIFLTHGHFDHIWGAKELKELSGAKLYALEEERELLQDARKNVSSQVGRAYTVDADVYLKDGEEITLADMTFQVIATPGHTAGGCCYYFKEAGFLVSGDTLFAGSVGRTDFPGGSYANIASSIKNKLYTLPDNTKVYPGHNSATTIIHEKESNFYI